MIIKEGGDWQLMFEASLLGDNIDLEDEQVYEGEFKDGYCLYPMYESRYVRDTYSFSTYHE